MLNKIKLKYYKLIDKRKKSGMNVLEFLVIVLIFMLMFAFFFDSFVILNQHNVATREANIVTRQIAMQGGVGNYEPAGYNRFGQDYETSFKIHQRVKNRLEGVNVENYKMYIERHGDDPLTAGHTEITTGSSIPIPYQESFEFVLQYEYKWGVLGQFIPGLDKARTRTINRSGVSELGGA